MFSSKTMFVATTMLAHVLAGVSALCLSRRDNFTASADFEDDDVCEGNKLTGQECDIAENAAGSLLAQNAVRPIFIKFHKVGGTTVMELINTFMGVNTNCGRSCGECFCEGEASACTGHISRVVLQHFVKAALSDKDSFLNKVDAADDAQLVTQEQRRQVFSNIDPWTNHHTVPNGVPLKWLPETSAQQTTLLFITLLRDPVERIRSKYYYTRGLSHLKNHQESHHMSFLKWMDTMRHDPETCCEYVASLGVGSLSTSKKVLASLIDVVGFTEEMDDVYLELAEQFGVPKAHLPPSISCRDDSTHKDDWTSEQLALAKEIGADDIELYQFARTLKKKRQQTA